MIKILKKIQLTRIDDRLIHGQFVTSWLKYIKTDAVLIIDDELANDEFMKRIYKAALPTNVYLFIYDFDNATKFLNNNNDEEYKNVIILVKSPRFIEMMLNSGIHIDNVILGAISAAKDRKKIVKNVYASKNEIKSMNEIISKEVNIYYQPVPNYKKLDVSNIIRKMNKI